MTFEYNESNLSLEVELSTDALRSALLAQADMAVAEQISKGEFQTFGGSKTRNKSQKRNIFTYIHATFLQAKG